MQNVAGAVIAAAGLGSRLGMGMPKCMIEVNGRTILSRLIETLSPHVPLVSVVVGYREDMVIEYCARHHPEVAIARNPDFRSTNTAYSLFKGAQVLNGKVLYLDGDIIISPTSLSQLVDRAAQDDVVIGVTEAKSKDPVFVNCREIKETAMVTQFSRREESRHEWANVFVAPHDILKGANGYVYECLERFLPAPAAYLDLHEVDTAEDLEQAKPFVMNLDSAGRLHQSV